jgi:hypothetical protein
VQALFREQRVVLSLREPEDCAANPIRALFTQDFDAATLAPFLIVGG